MVAARAGYHRAVSNVYGPPEPADIFARLRMSPGDAPLQAWKPGLGPWGRGPFVRPYAPGRPDAGLQVVVGQFALIGDQDTKPDNRPRMTNNARSEELEAKRTFRGPWARGQRCLVPVAWYDEPNYEAGPKCVWWRIRRAAAAAPDAPARIVMLAGLYNDWVDRATGEVHPSYTMLTVNADHHALLSRMHKPGDEKRAVVPIDDALRDDWLHGPVASARALLVLPPPDWYDAAPRPR